MKVIGVIPARYQSSRLPGKPLKDICGHPMIWWVYQQVSQVKEFSQIYVATDDERIQEACDNYHIPVLMTSAANRNPTERTHEVSTMVDGDIYVFVGGDEPLIECDAISRVIQYACNTEDLFVVNAMTTIKRPSEVLDCANIKMIANSDGDGLYTSRSPLPYPKGSLDFEYKKFVGICAFTKEALDFFVNTPQSKLEKIEECDLIRFIEHKKSCKFVDVDCRTVSVDTPKDLEYVRAIIQNKSLQGKHG